MSRTHWMRLSLCALWISSPAAAFELGMGILPPQQQKYVFRYNGWLQPKNFGPGDSSSSGLHYESLNVNLPVYRGEENGFALTTKVAMLSLAPVQSSVSDLYDIQFGASYTHVTEDKKMWSVSASFGSASDKPFRDSSVNTINATALYTFSSSPQSSWVLLVNYSNNRPILNNIPMPGFAYSYVPSKTFRGTFGAPFAMIFWQFEDKWSLNLFTLIPWIAKAQVSYSIMGPMQVYTGVDFSQMTFLQYGRVNSSERLYFDEKRAFLGFRTPLSRNLLTDLETGYSFGRQFFSATNYTPSPDSPLNLGSSWYGRLTMTAGF